MSSIRCQSKRCIELWSFEDNFPGAQFRLIDPALTLEEELASAFPQPSSVLEYNFNRQNLDD